MDDIWDDQFLLKHIFHIQNLLISVSIQLTTLVHELNGYKLCLNIANYPILNMQDFKNGLSNLILECFGHMVSTLCDSHLRTKHRQTLAQ